MNEEKMYYIQNGYVGNAMCWWAENSRGYTTDINKAGRYTAEQAKNIITRPQDIAWECDHIDNNLDARKTIIDSQYLNYDYRIVGNEK